MHGLIEADVLRFAAVILAGAVMLVTHYLVARSVYGDPETPPILRILAVIPPLTPILAYLRGKRAGAILWFGILTAYIVVRVVTA